MGSDDAGREISKVVSVARVDSSPNKVGWVASEDVDMAHLDQALNGYQMVEMSVSQNVRNMCLLATAEGDVAEDGLPSLVIHSVNFNV